MVALDITLTKEIKLRRTDDGLNVSFLLSIILTSTARHIEFLKSSPSLLFLYTNIVFFF